jgi:hypothetical protein
MPKKPSLNFKQQSSVDSDKQYTDQVNVSYMGSLRHHQPQPHAKLVDLMLLLTAAIGLKSRSKPCLVNDVSNYITIHQEFAPG